MRYPKGDTFLEQFGNTKELQDIKTEIAFQLFKAAWIDLQSAISLEKTLRKIKSDLENCEPYKVILLKHLKQVSILLTPTKIEQYIWWISYLEESKDLQDELYINEQLYKILIVEAILNLQELEKAQNNAVSQQEKYSEVLAQISVHRNQYQEILEQMNRITVINATIEEQLKSRDLD